MNIRAPELSALMTIFRSVGPVISTRRSSRSEGTGSITQSVSRSSRVSGRKSGSSPAASRRCRSARASSSSSRRAPKRRSSSATKASASAVRIRPRRRSSTPATSAPAKAVTCGYSFSWSRSQNSGHVHGADSAAVTTYRAHAERLVAGGGGGSVRRSAAVPVSLDKPIPAPQSRKQTRHLLIVSYLGSEVDQASGLSTLSFSKPVGFGSIPRLQQWRLPAR